MLHVPITNGSQLPFRVHMSEDSVRNHEVQAISANWVMSQCGGSVLVDPMFIAGRRSSSSLKSAHQVVIQQNDSGSQLQVVDHKCLSLRMNRIRGIPQQMVPQLFRSQDKS